MFEVAPRFDVRLEGSKAILGSLGPLDEDDGKQQSVNDLALTSAAQRNRSRLVIRRRNSNSNSWE
jgi:hypothetical protein